MSFSVILPTLNEKGHILKLIDEISNIFDRKKIKYEIIIVDDDSKDGTYEIVESYKKKKFFLKTISRKNKKKNLANSINEGILLSQFDNIIWLDADFQHPPRYINDLILKSENYDAIIASRFLKESDRYFNDPKLYKDINENQSYLFNKLCKLLLFKEITDYTSGYVCIKKSFFKDYSLKGFYGDYFVDMIVELKKKKFQVIEIPFIDAPRASGSSKTLVTINFKYLYTCIRYLLTLGISFIKKLS